MEFEQQLITQLTRIADSLEKLSEGKDSINEKPVLKRQEGLTDEENEKISKRHELDVWMGTFTEE